ncbi:MAG: ABC transporter substrate-binding protein [Ruminococcaceae bacterium]|nr:ABC transporter substrate-binding protein [Oscillospiraceae bacterium]
MKKLISILLALVLLLSLTACGVDVKEVKANVYGIAGPTGVGLANLMKDAKDGKGSLDYNMQLAASNDEIVAKITNKEADIAAVATNLASTLYNKTNGGVVVLAVNTLGVLNVVAKGVQVPTIASLMGKTIYTTGQGANPEYIINNVLKNNGLKVGKDVKVEFVSQPQELVSKVVTNEKAIVIAPQPVATAITVKDKKAKILININDEWEKFNDTKLVMGCVIARKEFVEQNPEAVEAFLEDYKASIEKTNKDIDGTAALCEEFGIVTPAAVAKKAIPLCNIVYEDGEELKTDLSAYLEFLYKQNPKSIGGKLPADDFYYGK